MHPSTVPPPRPSLSGPKPRALLLALLALTACSDDGDTPPANNGASTGLGATTSGEPMADNTPPPAMDSGAPPATQGEVEVTVAGGTLVGLLEEEDTRVFRGIPYGKPPVGELRFAPPQPADPWEGKLDAKEFGLTCPQAASTLSTFAEADKGEDCLSLNVYAPKDATGLPVMVFIYGGAFVTGGSATPGYDGKKLARHGVVVVTANYRLGALGFLSLPELDAQRGDKPSGNDGLRDQQLALQWVRDNIAAFGGDAANITLFGESAGSASVCAHSVSPASAGLADRYIMESGVCTGGLTLNTKDEANAVGQRLVDQFCAGEADVLACLRAVNAAELVAFGAGDGISGAGWSPTVEAPGDDIFPENPTVIVTEGRANPGNVLLGTNEFEWDLFVTLGETAPTNAEELDAVIVELAGEEALDAVKAAYPVTDEMYAEVSSRMVTDLIFRCPVRAHARARADNGSAVYLYSFEAPPALHASELSYVFGNPNTFLAPSFTEDLSQQIQRYWTRFAATGDPNGGSDPMWPAYTTEGDAHQVFDEPAAAASSGLATDTCDFWDALQAAAAAAPAPAPAP